MNTYKAMNLKEWAQKNLTTDEQEALGDRLNQKCSWGDTDVVLLTGENAWRFVEFVAPGDERLKAAFGNPEYVEITDYPTR